MPDRAHDRHRAGGDRAHDALVAEREQVLEAAAAAREHDHVDLRLGAHRLQRRHDRERRPRALDERLRDDDPRRREARLDVRDHVPLRRGVVARDEADPARQPRERALALGREQALVGELPLQPLERREVLAEAEALDRERPQAQVAALLEELRAAVDVDALAVGEVEPQPVELPARHRRRQARARLRVLEREEDGLPAGLAAELGDLALDPHRRQPLEPLGDPAVERGDGIDLAIAVDERLDRHGPSLDPGRVGHERTPGALEPRRRGEVLEGRKRLGEERLGLVAPAGRGERLGVLEPRDREPERQLVVPEDPLGRLEAREVAVEAGAEAPGLRLEERRPPPRRGLLHERDQARSPSRCRRARARPRGRP